MNRRDFFPAVGALLAGLPLVGRLFTSEPAYRDRVVVAPPDGPWLMSAMDDPPVEIAGFLHGRPFYGRAMLRQPFKFVDEDGSGAFVGLADAEE